MNLQQLEYILAVNRLQRFSAAAEHCNVTQPTLSAMVHKLEEELGGQIFDRSKHPVKTTEFGKEIIERAQKVVVEARGIQQYAREVIHEIDGHLSIGIIPTLAPYLLPRFVNQWVKAYPEVSLQIREMTTLHLVNELHNGNLDLAILAAPVEDDTLKAFKLFDEPFYLYTSDPVNKGKEIKPADLEPSRLWLLEEGHCMRSQILNFCELKQQGGNTGNMVYSAGSIESLVNLVDIYGGYTIIPALAKKYMSDDKQGYIYPFTNPQPVREISLVGLQSFPRKKVIQALHHLIIEQLPDDLDKLTDKIKVPHNVFKNTL